MKNIKTKQTLIILTLLILILTNFSTIIAISKTTQKQETIQESENQQIQTLTSTKRIFFPKNFYCLGEIGDENDRQIVFLGKLRLYLWSHSHLHPFPKFFFVISCDFNKLRYMVNRDQGPYDVIDNPVRVNIPCSIGYCKYEYHNGQLTDLCIHIRFAPVISIIPL